MASKDSLKEQLARLEEEAATLRNLIAAREEVAALRAQLASQESAPVIVPMPYPVYPVVPRPFIPWSPGRIVTATATLTSDTSPGVYYAPIDEQRYS